MPKAFKIRPACREDAEGASELWANLAQQHHAYDSQWWGWSEDAANMWRRGFDRDRPELVQLVAQEPDGKIVGMVRGRVENNPAILATRRRGAVWDIYVLPRCRLMGVEAALLEAVIDEFRRRGAQEMTVSVAHANQTAMAVYGKLGLRPVMLTMYKRL